MLHVGVVQRLVLHEPGNCGMEHEQGPWAERVERAAPAAWPAWEVERIAPAGPSRRPNSRVPSGGHSLLESLEGIYVYVYV